jgi:uncharacterized membrane protein
VIKKEVVMAITISRFRLAVVLVLLTLVGLVFRLIALSDRIYWTDECYTLLDMSGSTLSGMDNELVGKGICTPADFAFYQRPHGGVWQTIHAILDSEPEQLPLYVVLAKAAAISFGGNYHSARLVSCIAGTLLIPLSFWLSREIGTARSTALACATLVSISPFHVHLAQEARLYAMWTALIFLSSACLARALRTGRYGWWICYSVALTLCLYTIVLTLVVVMAHWLFALISVRVERLGTLTRMALANVCAAALLLPWIFGVVGAREFVQRTNEQAPLDQNLIEHMEVWAESASYLVGDVMNHGGLPRSQLLDDAQRAIAVVAALLLVYGGYRLIRFGPARAKWMVLSFWLAVFLVQAIPDLLLGGARSATIRYLIPAIGFGNFVVAIAVWAPPYITPRRWQARHGIFVALCLLCVVSLLAQSGQRLTWNRRGSAQMPAMAHVINEAPRPLVLYPRQGVTILPLSHLLDDDVRVFVYKPPLRTIPQGFASYFYLSTAGPPSELGDFEKVSWQPAIDLDGYKISLWQAQNTNNDSRPNLDKRTGVQ